MSQLETGHFWRLCANGNIEAVRECQQKKQQQQHQQQQQQPNFQVQAAVRVGRDVNERKGDGSTGLVSIMLTSFSNQTQQQQQQRLNRIGFHSDYDLIFACNLF